MKRVYIVTFFILEFENKKGDDVKIYSTSCLSSNAEAIINESDIDDSFESINVRLDQASKSCLKKVRV